MADKDPNRPPRSTGSGKGGKNNALIIAAVVVVVLIIAYLLFGMGGEPEAPPPTDPVGAVGIPEEQVDQPEAENPADPGLDTEEGVVETPEPAEN